MLLSIIPECAIVNTSYTKGNTKENQCGWTRITYLTAVQSANVISDMLAGEEVARNIRNPRDLVNSRTFQNTEVEFHHHNKNKSQWLVGRYTYIVQ